MLDRTQKREGKRSRRWEKGYKKRRNGDGIFLH